MSGATCVSTGCYRINLSPQNPLNFTQLSLNFRKKVVAAKPAFDAALDELTAGGLNFASTEAAAFSEIVLQCASGSRLLAQGEEVGVDDKAPREGLQEEGLPINETAWLLRRTHWGIRWMLRNGRISAIRTRRGLRFPRSEILRLIQKGKGNGDD